MDTLSLKLRGDLFDSLSDGFAAFAADGTYLYVNRVALLYLGLEADRVLGNSVWNMFPELQSSQFGTTFASVLSSGEAHSYEELLPRRDRFSEVRVYREGAQIHVFWRDITERKRAAEQLATAVAMREAFLQAASHELRTPLTALKVAAYLLRGAKEGEPRAEAMGVLDRSVARIEGLVAQLIDAAALIGRSFEVTKVQSPLPALLALIEAELPKSCTFVVRGSVDQSFHVDTDRVSRAVLALVSNACKFGGDAPVFLEVQSEADRLAFEVRDSGPGMAENVVESLAVPFTRASAIRNHGGLGLGITLARAVATAHRGDLSIESVEGGGTTVRMTLR